MSKIEKNAGIIAAEIVENYIKMGIDLDSEYIAEKSCDIAYKIHEKSKSYNHDEVKPKTEKEILKLVADHVGGMNG